MGVLSVGSAMAQEGQPAEGKAQGEKDLPSSTAEPGQETKDKTQPTPPYSTTASPKPATNTRTAPSEMNVQTYKGVLVDAACALPHGGAVTKSAAPGSPATTPSSAAGAVTPPSTSGAAASTADRVATDQACSISSSTNLFALKLQDGNTIRFDTVGNDRAQEAVKTKKKWIEAATSGKPINAKIKGAMSGEKLIVSSIN
jgi:phosphotransferase system HPr-like phosphotransfer protein